MIRPDGVHLLSKSVIRLFVRNTLKKQAIVLSNSLFFLTLQGYCTMGGKPSAIFVVILMECK